MAAAAAKGRSTAERILDEAERLFAAKGFAGAALADVADAVGIRGPSIHKHFATKRALYEAVLERRLDPFFDLLDALAAESPGEARARSAVRQLLAHHAAHPHLAQLIQQATLAGGDELTWLFDRWYGPFSERVRGLLPAAPRVGTRSLATSEAALVMAFNALILGYVTLAPLHARMLDRDPLAPEALAAYETLLEAFSRPTAAD
ncbi:MAG: TetR/AcrR family transcriptional regulator [Proteobacteria bacterium]|nr:TetR/AcrR family transcriptional regulator [Pseudomonadota bacterium]